MSHYTAALAANPTNPPPNAYDALVAPYPVWAAIHECGITRSHGKHWSVAAGLFKDDFETCLDLNDTAPYQYFKNTAMLPATLGLINFQIYQRNSIRAFVQ